MFRVFITSYPPFSRRKQRAGRNHETIPVSPRKYGADRHGGNDEAKEKYTGFLRRGVRQKKYTCFGSKKTCVFSLHNPFSDPQNQSKIPGGGSPCESSYHRQNRRNTRITSSQLTQKKDTATKERFAPASVAVYVYRFFEVPVRRSAPARHRQ